MIEPRMPALQVALAATLCPDSFAQTGAADFDLLIENGTFNGDLHGRVLLKR